MRVFQDVFRDYKMRTQGSMLLLLLVPPDYFRLVNEETEYTIRSLAKFHTKHPQNEC